MILEDQVQHDKGPVAGVPGAVPHNTEKVVVDTSKLPNEVGPIKTYTLYLS